MASETRRSNSASQSLYRGTGQSCVTDKTRRPEKHRECRDSALGIGATIGIVAWIWPRGHSPASRGNYFLGSSSQTITYSAKRKGQCIFTCCGALNEHTGEIHSGVAL